MTTMLRAGGVTETLVRHRGRQGRWIRGRFRPSPLQAVVDTALLELEHQLTEDLASDDGVEGARGPP